ncbi:MAG: hypothetical protein L6R38_006632 [Xanthoria sp. 2 TBL-2021]|nr:MAG: hypothetical protein L6R38_006632 [Xanthoria sp. 2 TBL-2021]
MDLNSLKDQVSNLTLYDLKAGVRKVQNAVMNYTEMESKVREATNNEPWGASSSLMQEIANATHSYQLLNEIMPMIYKRFTEKSAEEWRQIYKGLQLLEFLIKNGSERVIDDARSHMSLLKMLRQFHFIDQNGKDQGINVRNRSKELTELLSDVDRIRGERKKARANRNKFGGVEGGAMGGGMSSGSRYGGFGSESAGYGGYSGGVYGDGGGFGGNTSEFQDSTSRRDKFEEYDEGDDGTTASTTARRKPEATSSTARRETQKSAPPKKKEPEIDILSFDVDDIPPKTPPKDFTSNGKKASSNPMDNGFGSLSAGGANEEDDFDDFQSATPNPQTTSKPSGLGLPLPTPSSNTTTQFAAPKPISSSQGANLNDLVGFNSISPAPSLTGITSPPASTFTTSPPPPSAFQSPPPLSTMQQQQQPKPTGYRAAQPNYYTSVQIQPSNSTQPGMSKPTLTSNPSYSSTTTLNKPAGGAKPSAGDAFSNLWSTASSTAGIKKTNTPSNAGPNLASMAKEKASQGMWGASPAPTMTGSMASGQKIQSNGGQQQKVGGGLDDLLG